MSFLHFIRQEHASRARYVHPLSPRRDCGFYVIIFAESTSLRGLRVEWGGGGGGAESKRKVHVDPIATSVYQKK